MIEIKARINPISYEKPNYKRRILHFSLLTLTFFKIFFRVADNALLQRV